MPTTRSARPAVRVRSTDAHFKVSGVHVDGKDRGTLTIEAPKASGAVLVSFRPAHGRAYTLTVQEVCELIAWRAARKEIKR